MDVLGTLQVRFHFNGDFIRAGNKLHYVGGSEAMSYIGRDKVSLPEFVGHLKDHCTVGEATLMHWLIPGNELTNGLRAVVDDKACMDINNQTDEGCVADIYVEGSFTNGISEDEGSDDEESDYENGIEEGSEEGSEELEEEADYVEDVDLGSGGGQVVMSESRDKVQKQVEAVKQFYSPSKGQGGRKTDLG